MANAKDARVTYEGQGIDRVQIMHYPAIGRVFPVPIGLLFAQYGQNGYEQGMRTRFSNFRAVDGNLTDREKDQQAFEKCVAYTNHLLAGGDWKMSGERDTVTEVIDAMIRLQPKKYSREVLLEAVKHDPDQVKGWRANKEVKLELARERTRKLEAEAEEDQDELIINLPK